MAKNEKEAFMRAHDREMSGVDDPPTHTPGPWNIRTGHGCYHAVSDNGAFSTGCISFDGNGRANVSLVAAAPDLLAALRAALGVLTGDFTKNALIHALNCGRAAILKAEGIKAATSVDAVDPQGGKENV